jgi:uncharacterized iron-regulated membrane protein
MSSFTPPNQGIALVDGADRQPSRAQRAMRQRTVLWRIHAWAALIATPFALVATLTGILYIFTPQIERQLHGHLDTVAVNLDTAVHSTAAPLPVRLPLDQLVQAALQQAPQGMALQSVITPARAQDTVRVVVRPLAATTHKADATHADHAAHQHGSTAGASSARIRDGNTGTAGTANASGSRMPAGQVFYVNPYNAQVLGSHAEMDRFSLWARRLHSSLLQGESWRWMIELAASWMLVMLLTGVWLWWPERSGLPVNGSENLPAQIAGTAATTRSQQRARWKVWHAWLGVALSLMSLVILVTGLTWSRYAGDQIRSLRDATGQAPPSAPKGLRSVPELGHTSAMTWEAIWQTAQRVAPSVSMQLRPPTNAQGVWRLAEFDRSQPTKRFNLVLDAYTGRILFYAGWSDQTVFSKSTAVGIPFHRGEFGLWNQAVLLVFGLGVLFSIVSGWVMFFRRRRFGLLGLPKLAPGAWRSLSPIGWMLALVLAVAMPLLALSGAVVALIELVWSRLQSKRAVLLSSSIS